jgi:CRP/FNR family cyclic AMP-dependent transcriptional regulator
LDKGLYHTAYVPACDTFASHVNTDAGPLRMTRYQADPALLRKLAPFSWFTETQLTWALPATERRTYAAHASILKAGDKADGLFILLSGAVRLVHQDGEGHELVAEIVRPQEFFGELGLFDGADCPVSIEAQGPCEVLFVPRKVVLECLEDNARAAMCMLRSAVSRLCATHHKLGKVALTTVSQRVAMVLLENGLDADGEWRVEVGAEQIASMVGASREMVSRVIKGLIEKGIVRRLRRKLIVTNREALHGCFTRNPRPAAAAAEAAS